MLRYSLFWHCHKWNADFRPLKIDTPKWTGKLQRTFGLGGCLHANCRSVCSDIIACSMLAQTGCWTDTSKLHLNFGQPLASCYLPVHMMHTNTRTHLSRTPIEMKCSNYLKQNRNIVRTLAIQCKHMHTFTRRVHQTHSPEWRVMRPCVSLHSKCKFDDTFKCIEIREYWFKFVCCHGGWVSGGAGTKTKLFLPHKNSELQNEFYFICTSRRDVGVG